MTTLGSLPGSTPVLTTDDLDPVDVLDGTETHVATKGGASVTTTWSQMRSYPQTLLPGSSPYVPDEESLGCLVKLTDQTLVQLPFKIGRVGDYIDFWQSSDTRGSNAGASTISISGIGWAESQEDPLLLKGDLVRVVLTDVFAGEWKWFRLDRSSDSQIPLGDGSLVFNDPTYEYHMMQDDDGKFLHCDFTQDVVIVIDNDIDHPWQRFHETTFFNRNNFNLSIATAEAGTLYYPTSRLPLAAEQHSMMTVRRISQDQWAISGDLALD